LANEAPHCFVKNISKEMMMMMSVPVPADADVLLREDRRYRWYRYRYMVVFIIKRALVKATAGTGTGTCSKSHLKMSSDKPTTTRRRHADAVPASLLVPWAPCSLGKGLWEINIVYKKNQMSTDRESGRGKKRARVIRGSRNFLFIFLFLGLRFFSLFFFLLGGLHCFFL
jgi:hypothetical protein